MIKAARIALSLAAVAGVGATFAACGGVPGNAVATVDGEAIDKQEFNHWLTVAAKSSGQQNAAVPDPPNYTKCVAAKRKTTPAPAKGQPKVTDTQLKTQCKTEYDQLRNQVLQLLISFQWIQGEASTMDVKVTDAEVKKSFDEQKKQSFPKAEDYKKFLSTSGQTEEDILQRVKLDLLSNKIRDKVVKGKDKVSDKAIEDFYNKNKARFAQPEKRDLRVVLTKDKANADKAKAALDSGDSWSAVAKKYFD
jgi:foldase protein PrsA